MFIDLFLHYLNMLNGSIGCTEYNVGVPSSQYSTSLTKKTKYLFNFVIENGDLCTYALCTSTCVDTVLGGVKPIFWLCMLKYNTSNEGQLSWKTSKICLDWWRQRNTLNLYFAYDVHNTIAQTHKAYLTVTEKVKFWKKCKTSKRLLIENLANSTYNLQ